MKKILLTLILLLTTVTPIRAQIDETQTSRGRIQEVNQVDCEASIDENYICYTYTVILKDNEKSIVTMPSTLESSQKPFKVGDSVYLTQLEDLDGENTWSITGYARGNTILICTLAFILLAIVIGGLRSLGSILSLIGSFIIIYFFIIPQIISTGKIVLIGYIGVFLILILGMYLSHGFRKLTSISLIATLVGVGIVSVLSLIVLEILNINGLGDETAFLLSSQMNGEINIKLLFFISILIGAAGVSTDGGVTVDFGPYNAMDGEKVSVKELSADSDSIEGGTRTAYDISAGERTEFDGLLTITLPYDESETDSTDEEGSVLAEYYNRETGEWELVNYTVNITDNTVTITTDHLSEYCTVTLRDAGSPYALLSKFSSKRLDDETALAILQEFEASGKPGEVGDSLLRGFYKQFLPIQYQQYLGDAEAELVHEVQGWLMDVSELAAQGGGYKQAANILEKSGYMLLGVSALSLGDTMIDAYKGNESAETVAAEAYKLSYNVGVTLLDYKKITTGMVQLSMLGVIALDYSLNKFMVAADQTYKDALFNVIIAYNEEIHPWTDTEWYARIMGLYKTRGDDPKKFNAALRGIMENYSSRYFFDNPEEQLVATNEAGLHAYTTGLLPETDAAKEYCIEQYMARLGERLQPVLEDVVKRMRYDSLKAYSKNATELRQALNAPLEFEIIEEIPDGEKSKYAGATVVISRPGAPVGGAWTVGLDKDGRASLDATIVGYIQAGLPTQLRLWNKGDDHYEDAPALTQEFKVTEKVTVISLGQMRKDFEYYLVERYDLDPRLLYYDGYGYEIMAVKRDMQSNRLTDHLIRGIDAEVEQDSYREYIYDSSAGLLTTSDAPHQTELKPNVDWTAIRGYSSSPEFRPGKWGMEEGKTGKMLYEYIRYLAVNQLSPGKWQVDETGETIEYVLHSFDASDQQSKRLESPSGRSFLEEARSFATEMGIEMYDGQGYD